MDFETALQVVYGGELQQAQIRAIEQQAVSDALELTFIELDIDEGIDWEQQAALDDYIRGFKL